MRNVPLPSHWALPTRILFPRVYRFAISTWCGRRGSAPLGLLTLCAWCKHARIINPRVVFLRTGTLRDLEKSAPRVRTGTPVTVGLYRVTALVGLGGFKPLT